MKRLLLHRSYFSVVCRRALRTTLGWCFLLSALAPATLAQLNFGTVQPSSGTFSPGNSIQFTLSGIDTSDAWGSSNDYLAMVVQTAGLGVPSTFANACVVEFQGGHTNTVFLASNAGGSPWGTGQIASSTPLPNSQCTVYLSGASESYIPGNPFSGLTANFQASFTPAFAGQKDIYIGTLYAGSWNWYYGGSITIQAVSASVSTVSASPVSVAADGTGSSTVTVTLMTGAGSPVSGKTVSLAQGSGHSTITTASGTTNGSGQATFTVTDTTVESVTYTATDTTDSLVITPTATVGFAAVPVSASASTVTASPAAVAADGVTTSTITVTLKTAGGVAVSGKTVTLGQGTCHSTISAASGASNTSGVVTFTVKDTTVETVTYTVTDTADSLVITSTAAVSFTAVPPSASTSTVTASPAAVAADGVTTSTITVTLKTAGGSAVSGKTVTLGQGTGHSTISAASGTSNASGVVTFTVTDTTVESVTYTATDTTDSLVITSTAAVGFIAVPPSASTSTVTASPAAVAADGVTTSTITVTLKTAGGVAVSGKTVTLGQGTCHSTISAASGASNASGVVTFTVKDTTVETVTYTATDATDSLVVTPIAAVSFTAVPASASASTVTASPAAVAADGASTSMITVTLKTAGGVAVSGKTVMIAQASGHSTISAASGPSSASGVVTFTVTDTTVESVTYTATDTTDSVVVTPTAGVTFTAAPPTASQSTVTANPTSAPADGATASTITVTLKNALGNPVSGKTVTLAQGSGHATISPASGPSSANGVVTFTVTDTTPESVTYTATDTTDSVVVTQTAAVTFTPLLATAVQSTVTASLASDPADGTTISTITVTLKNALGNPVSGKAVSLGQGTGHSTISAASGPSSASGVVTFTVSDTTVEFVTYTAVDTTDAVTVAQTSGVVFTAAPPNAIQSKVIASPSSAPADGASTSTITVTLKNAGGYPVSGKTVMLAQGGGHGVISAASGTSNASGVVTFTVTDATAESVTYTATDTTDTVAVTQTAGVTFTPLPALSISSTHAGNFWQGESSATYSLIVGNGATAGSTSGAVTVTETVPTGMTLVSMAGTGWTCTTLPTCTRNDALAGGGSYPAITVTVNVAANSGTPLSNQVSVSGGGSAAANGTDSTTVVPLPNITALTPSSGAVGTSVTITGTNFSSTPSTNSVTFNGTAATVTNSTATTLTVSVPGGATSGNVVVTIGGLASNGWNFTVAPSITGLSPTSGAVGTSVTISGSNFGTTQGSSIVTFAGGVTTFAYSRTLTIDPTKCGSADSPNFPILVSASDTSLKDVAHGGNVQKSDASDILFYSDAGGATQLASEVESYDNVNGILVAWVQVANVSHTSSTSLYVFYGSAIPPARTPNPWDGHYAAVYHLSAAAFLADSTSNANALANGGATPIAGLTGSGASSAGNGYQYFKHPSPAGFPAIGSANTLEGWANYSVSSPSGGLISLGGNDGPAPLAAEELLFVGGGVAMNKNGAITQISAPAPSANAWHHFAYTTDGSNNNVLYVDGVQAAANSVSNDSGSTGAFRVFGFSDTYQPNDYAGKGDELRVSTIARSASWIQTEYHNENAPGNIGSPGFLTWGPQVPISSGPVTATVTNWTPTSITATVPGGAATSNVVVTVGGIPSNGVNFTVMPVVAAPTISPAQGTYTTPQTVTLTPVTPGSTIRYTTDGTTPSQANGTLYTALFTVSATTTVRVIAYESGSVDSSVNGVTYTITGTVSAPTFSVPTGTYTTAQTLTLNTTPSTASIRYTTDGTTPTETTGTVYAGPISVGVSETIKAIGYQTGWINSTISSASYGMLPSITSLNPSSGPVGTSVTISGSNFGSPQGSSMVTFGGAVSAFAYSRSLAIDPTKCGSAVSPSFPVLVSASDTSLKDVAHGGHVQKSNGSDILFYSDAGGATQLASEIESYDNIQGVLVAWVQVQAVSNTSNPAFYLMYGSSAPPARTANPWDSHYRGVWHLGSSFADSTGNGQNGGATGTGLSSVPGLIGTGLQSSGATGSGSVSAPASVYGGGGPTTISLWIKTTGLNTSAQSAYLNKLDWANSKGYAFWTAASTTTSIFCIWGRPVISSPRERR